MFCHRNPSRSFFFKGRQFPLCARCTGLTLGFSLWPLFTFDIVQLNLFISLLLIFPTFIDGGIQYYSRWESNNWLRFGTGLAAGGGLMSLAAIIGTIVANFIKSFY